MRRYLMATAAIISVLTVAAADKPPGDKFTVRCLNKDSVVKYDEGGKLNLELELTLTLPQEIQIKPGDVRLWLLDSQLRQLEGGSIVLPEDWKTRKFKKGENKDTLTLHVPAPGALEEGREYYVAVNLIDYLRLVKFKVGKAAP